MKSFVFAFIMIFSLSTFEVLADDNKNNVESEMIIPVNKYISIDLKELPDTIQDVLAMDYTCYSVNSADVKSLDGGKHIFKVILLDQENIENTILLSDKGELLE